MSYTQLLLKLLMLPVLDIRCYDFCPSHLTRYQLMLGGQRHSRIQRLLKAFTYDCVKSGIQPGTARSLAHFAVTPHSVMTDYVCHMYHAWLLGVKGDKYLIAITTGNTLCPLVGQKTWLLKVWISVSHILLFEGNEITIVGNVKTSWINSAIASGLRIASGSSCTTQSVWWYFCLVISV